MKKYLKLFLICFVIAYLARIFGHSINAHAFETTLIFSILIIGSWLAATARGRDTLSMSFTSLFLWPTPLIGAAKAFGWLFLLAFIASCYKVSFEGSAQNQLVGVILLAISLLIFYLTPLSTLINAYADAGEKLRLKQSFDALSKGFPEEYRYHNKHWAGFAVNPSTRTVVISARRMIRGEAGGQIPEVLVLKFEDIADCGLYAPGYEWKGILVGAGAMAAGSSFVSSLNDLTWQRLKGSFNTGILFALHSGDLYIVQAQEKHLENLANVIAGTIR